jgi:hypothetical protein
LTVAAAFPLTHALTSSFRMNREMTLELEEFSRAAVEAEARRQGLDVATLLARSAQYYILERASERLSARVPSFVQSDTAAEHGLPLRVTIDLGDGHWHQLDSAAAHEGLSVERLFEHAALLFLADLESGRVATRLLESAETGR